MPDVGIVVPCYNEASRFDVDAWSRWVRSYPSWSWLFVNDGSRDATLSVLRRLTSEANVQLLDLSQNQGKAEAVRAGLLHFLASGAPAWIGYLDADLATAPSELATMLSAYGQSEALMLSGCRLGRLGAQVNRSIVRHYGGRVVATAISMLLRLPTYDTQCGAKLLRSGFAREVLETRFHSRWLFDVELFARARNRLGRVAVRAAIIECPLSKWEDQPGTKLRLQDVLKVPFELWKLHRVYNGRERAG